MNPLYATWFFLAGIVALGLVAVVVTLWRTRLRPYTPARPDPRRAELTDRP